jgi:tetratricopeptide (TPR) repeat protein
MTRLASLALYLSCIAGCADSAGIGPDEPGAGRDVTERLFDSAIGLLNRLSDIESDEALVQIGNRLNQWSAAQKAMGDGSVDPLVAALPAELRQTPLMQSLGELKFASADAAMLREAVWLREAARSAVGRELDPLQRAKLLFDWTVRNLQLEADATSGEARSYLPWQTLIIGRATAEERAWVFALLAREQGLDVVLLATGEGETLPLWLPALLHDEQLWLFDAELGLPIPGDEADSVATLAEGAENPEVLERLKVEGQPPYRITAEGISQVTALVVASPQSLSERMRLVENHLAGPQRLELTVDASRLAERLQQMPHVGQVQLWQVPIERARSPDRKAQEAWRRQLRPFHIVQGDWLWKGRIFEISGRLGGEDQALVCLMRARPADEDIATARENKQIDASVEADVRKAKQDASYWLGLASYERGNFDAAIDWFSLRTLAASPGGSWTEGARYNLARTYEALGRRADAIRTYRSTQGPQRTGNLLRARSLSREDKAPAS